MFALEPYLQEQGCILVNTFGLRPVQGWPRMNIKVKLPFLFTFHQLRGATCSDQYWLCLLSTRVLDPEEVEI